VVDEGGPNTDWNPVWASKSSPFDGGWAVEMAIPLKSIRYRAGSNQVWGIQIRRSIRHKNEWDYLTPVPRIFAGPMALNRISAGGTLVGLDLPEVGKNIELKPYAISRSTTDNVRTPRISNEISSAVGGDVKYAITPNLTADLTLNTDFAQVEVDEQQVNLTRFSLFFPEKREFFLEGRGTFEFARGGGGGMGGMGGGGGGFGGNSDVPTLFYTRRIGLNNGRVVPINAGGRLTGKLGPWAIGLMDVQTREDGAANPATNYSVVRLKRDVFSRSSIGVIGTNRSVGPTGTGSNSAYGVDGAFSPSQAFLATAYWARTNTTGKTTNDQSYQGVVDYSVDRYGARAEHLSVGANFDPQVGFRRRANFNRSFASARFSPRPKHMPRVRKFTWSGSAEYVETGAGAVDARGYTATFNTEFASSDLFSINFNNDYENITQAFTPSGSPKPIGIGPYEYNSVAVAYAFGAQRRVAGTLTVQGGQYYDGTIRSVTFGSGGGMGFSMPRISLHKRLALEPTVTYTEVDRPSGSFVTRLARTRVDYAFGPLMFATALFQYSSADRAFSTNLRFRWEYAPGSELFLVYTDERDTTDERYATPTTVRGLKNRALVIKVNRLLRY
jgi:hypothetical protein